MFKLVLIDDDAEVLAINQKYLTGAGFTVYTAISPREGVLSIRKNLPDCILLDVMLPEADGYRVCRYIRSFSSVPILFLTARSSEEDVIRGLTCGGDDYLVKPYSLRELKARVDLLIRRRRQLAQASSDLVLTIGNLSIDRVAHKAFYREQDLHAAVQVSRHPVGASHVYLFASVILEDKDPRMFQKFPDDGADFNILGKSRNSCLQTADSTDHQMDLDTSAGRLI